MISALFWDFTQDRMLVSCRRSRTTHQPHLQDSFVLEDGIRNVGKKLAFCACCIKSQKCASHSVSWDSWVSVVSGWQAAWSAGLFSGFLAETRDLWFLQDVETSCGLHPMVPRGGVSLPGLEQLTAQLHLVPSLRMAGAVPVLALHGIYKYSFTFLDPFLSKVWHCLPVAHSPYQVCSGALCSQKLQQCVIWCAGSDSC
jgi:hypothetical protein